MRYLPITIKAIQKWNNESVMLKPVMFPLKCEWYVIGSGSIFCNRKSEFEITGWQNVKVLFCEFVHWIVFVLWRNLRYRYPYKIKLFFNPPKDDFLPF